MPTNLLAVPHYQQTNKGFCLVFVLTGDLPYWNENTAHVMVAVGIDNESIYVNDPAFENAPQFIPLDYFLLAWSEFDHRCAIIKPKHK